MQVNVDVYRLREGVVVYAYQHGEKTPECIANLLKRPKTIKDTARVSLAIGAEGLISPQCFFALYTNGLNRHFGPQVNFEGRRKELWDEGMVDSHVTELASFCYKHVQSLYGEEKRLVHMVIPPKGHDAKEVFSVIRDALDLI